MSPVDDDVSLKDLIRAVSRDLIASRAERMAENREPIFEVDELTLEVNFVVTESGGGGGGFDLRVIKADAKADYKEEKVQKVTLKLRPVREGDDAGGGRAPRVLRELGNEVPLRPRTSDE